MEFERIVTGFAFLEGPRVDEAGTLYFSDVMLGGAHMRAADGTIGTVVRERKWIGGLALNHDGGIICSGHGGLCYAHPKSGQSRSLLAAIGETPINAVNDIQPDGRGGLYFGTYDGAGLLAGRTPEPGALHRLDPDGRVTTLRNGIPMSNGLGLSPDGKRLYHSRTFEGLFVYSLGRDGEIESERQLAEFRDSDGLAVDAEEHIWVCHCRSGEIRRYRPDGAVERAITAPARDVLSLTFGGDDLRDLYVVTAYEGAGDESLGAPMSRTGAVYKTRSPVAGLPLARTRFHF
ncbi:MAG TPA: SMP-30/gluconolactonase/LRE family protein [Alphaproteobacteria bacterium]|nr:SMP-30/gluconolactonase/LRE family protein [Alphaproteobacteria bacterium]